MQWNNGARLRQWSLVCALWVGAAAHADIKPDFSTEKLSFSYTYNNGGSSQGYRLQYLSDLNAVAGQYLSASRGGSISYFSAWNAATGLQLPDSTPTSGAVYAFNNLNMSLVNDSGYYVPGQSTRYYEMFARGMNDHGVIVGGQSGVGYWRDINAGTSGQISISDVQGIDAYGVNNNGLVVGRTSTGGFVYNVASGQSELLPGAGYAVNDAGTVVGTMAVGGDTHFFMKSAGGGVVDLSLLPNAPTGLSTFSSAALNNQGQMVYDHWYFDGSAWRDINAYFNVQGGSLTLLDINNQGNILAAFAPPLGKGQYDSQLTSYFLLKPSDTYVSYNFAAYVPEPSSWALMGLGLVGVAWAARRPRAGASSAGA